MAEDRILKCKECSQEFVFTVGEQEFYAQKGFQNEPVRCAPCRRAKKRERSAMSGVQFRDRQSFGVRSFSSGYNRPRY